MAAGLRREIFELGEVGAEDSTIGEVTNPSHARYDSAVVTAQKRLSAGMTFLTTLTWSKNKEGLERPALSARQLIATSLPLSAMDLLRLRLRQVQKKIADRKR